MRTRLVAALAAALITLLACAAPVGAHVDLVDTNPDDGAVLPAPPDELVLTFTEEVELVPDGIRLFDADGEGLDSSSAPSGTGVEVDVPARLPDGTYVLVWRVVSVDGHPRAGALTFSVGTPSARVEAPDVVASDRAWLTTLGSVVDAAVYAALLVAVGLAVFALVVVPAGECPSGLLRRLRPVVTAAAVVGAVAAVLRVVVVTLDQNGLVGADLLSASTWGSLPLDATVGSGLLVAGLGVLRAAVASGPTETRRRLLLAGGGLASLTAPTLAGHTRSLDPALLVAVVDAWHLLAASVWLGGLLGLALAWKVLNRRTWTAALARFSTLAAGVLLVLVPTGALLGWRIVETWTAFTTSAYGRLLLAKAAVVLVVVALAAWNRWVLLPRGGDSRLRHTVAVEAALLLAVAGLTGVLVNQSPRPVPPTARPVASVTATGSLTAELEVAVRLSPALVGDNDVRVVLRDGSGNAVEVSTPPRLVLSGPGGESVAADLTLAVDGSFEGEVEVGVAGEWRVEVSQRLDEFNEPSEVVVVDVADD